MPVTARCPECHHRFSVPASKQGRRIRCELCGADCRIVSQKGRSGSGRRRKKKSSAVPVPLILAGLGGFLAVGLLIFAANTFLNRDGADAVASDGNGNGSVTKTLTDEEKAANQAAYQANLAKQRAQNAKNQFERMIQRYGRDKVVAVEISNVPGDPAAADRYLNRKVFRAAFHDYKQASENAQKATEANRKKAEKDAVDSSSGYIGMVWYQYQRVESDLPYPQIVAGPRSNGVFTYYASPVLDLNAFANRLAVGTTSNVDSSGRKVTVKAQLPVPVPDPDVEEMQIQYGLNAVVKLRVNGTQGEADRVAYYLEQQAGLLDPEKNLKVMGLKNVEGSDYEMYVAPVDSIDQLASLIGFGDVEEVDAANHTVTIAANLPDDLPKPPTAAELAEQRRLAAEAERNKPTDWDKEPRPGEDFFVWVARILKGNNSSATEAVLEELNSRDVDPAHLDEVSKVLIAKLDDTWHFEEHLQAMMRWRTKETEDAVFKLGGTHHASRYPAAIMSALGQIGTPKAIEALASGLTDRSRGKQAADELIKLGSQVEPEVLKYGEHRSPDVRALVYYVLRDVGTKASLTQLNSNAREEINARMKDQAIAARTSVLSRINASRQASDDGSPFQETTSGATESNPFTETTSDDAGSNPFTETTGDDSNPFQESK